MPYGEVVSHTQERVPAQPGIRNTPRARGLINRSVDYYNNHRMHQALEYDTPASWYHTGINQKAA